MRSVAMLLAVCACQAPPKKSEPPTSEPGTIFTYARAWFGREQRPARFSALLPFTLEGYAFADRYPPDGVVTADLECGAADARKRVIAAVVTAARRGPIPDLLVEYYHRLFGSRPAPAVCELLRAQLDARPRAAREVFWQALARCRDPEDARAFERGDAPDTAVVEWYAGAEEPMELSPRLTRAATNVARKGSPPDLRQVGVALSRVEGAAAVRAVRQLQRRVRDPERRAWIGVGLAGRPEEAARSLARRACAHPAVRLEPECDRPFRGGFDVDSDARADDADVDWLVSAYGGTRTADALARCVLEGDWDDERLRCLERLARFDWSRAVEVASTVAETLAESSPMREIVSVLERFPESGQIEAGLREHGLIGDESRSGASPADLLVAHGRALRFVAWPEPAYEGSAEVGRYVLGHEWLLHDLAALVRPELDCVAFQQVAGERHRLRAWDGERLYESRLRKLAGWYDVPAVVGLLNSLLRARKSDERLLTIAGGAPRTATVVAGPADAIEAAVEAGLIAPRGRPAAE